MAGVVAALAVSSCGAAIDITARDATPEVPPAAAELRGVDQHGNDVDLRAIASAQPTLLIFYRGHW